MTRKRDLPRQRAVVALVVCLLALIPWENVQGQVTAPAQVRITPTSLQVPEGGTIDVAVEVREVEGLYGADLVFTFDPDVVEVVDADPSQDGVQVALGLFLDPGFVLRNLADNVQGKVHFAMTQLNPSEAKSGSGVLIVVKLRGKRAGATPLTMVNAQLARRDGIGISATTADGQVEVLIASAAADTSTPIPSQGAGTPLPTSTLRPTAQPTATPLLPTDTPQPAETPTRVAPAVPSVTVQPTETYSPSPTLTDRLPVATNTLVPAVPSLAEITAVVQPTETASPVVIAQYAVTASPAVVAVSPPILSASENRSESQPTAESPSTNRSLLGVGLVLLMLATLLIAGMGAVWWVRRSKTYGRDDL